MEHAPDFACIPASSTACAVFSTAPFASRLLQQVRHLRMQRLALRSVLLQLLYGEFLPVPLANQCGILQTLCNGLLDYAATGHFEVYGLILRQQQCADSEARLLLGYLMRSIGKTTDALLLFNDHYAYWPHRCHAEMNSVRLFEDVRKLSRHLLLRFVLEEQLLELVSNT